MRQCTLMRIFGFILAVVGSITSHDAQANVITQTHNFGSSPIFNGDVGNSIFNQFDPSLGNLTGVGLGVSGDATFSVDFTPVYCDDPDFGPYNCSDVTAAFFIGFYFLGPGLPPNPSAPFLNPNDNFSYSLNSNTPETAGPVTIGAGAFINPLTGYVGTGDVFIDFLTGVDVFCDGSGVSVFCSDNADLSLSLTYTYTPVPEPNTILLLITSVGLMGVVSLFASSRILRI